MGLKVTSSLGWLRPAQASQTDGVFFGWPERELAALFRVMRSLLHPLAAALVLTAAVPFLSAQDDEKETETEKKPKFEEKDFRTFKSKNGRSLKARVVSRIDDERYSVETPEGKSFTLNVNNLSRSDQTYLELWEPGAILDLASADLEEVLEKMGYSAAALTASGDRLMLTVTVSDKELKFLLDPSQKFSTLDPAIAMALGITLGQGTINFKDAAGKVERSQQGSLKEFSLGEMEIKSHLFQVISMSRFAGGQLPKDTAGAIGGDLLKKLHALVDYAGKQLFVRENE